MSRRPRRNHTAGFRPTWLGAIKGEKTLSELSEQFDVHTNQITQWKSQFLEGAVGFSEARRRRSRNVYCGSQDPPCQDRPTDAGERFLEGALTKAGSSRTGLRPWGGSRDC